MKRRRDRGELSGWHVLPVIFLCGFLCGVMVHMCGLLEYHLMRGNNNVRHIRHQMERIADAVCVEAPPAEPVKEK